MKSKWRLKSVRWHSLADFNQEGCLSFCLPHWQQGATLKRNCGVSKRCWPQDDGRSFRRRVAFALAGSFGALTFRLVLVLACSLISYSPVTRTSLWISSRRHFLELTGRKKEMVDASSTRSGKSRSAVNRAMAERFCERPTSRCQLLRFANSLLRPRDSSMHNAAAAPSGRSGNCTHTSHSATRERRPVSDSLRRCRKRQDRQNNKQTNKQTQQASHGHLLRSLRFLNGTNPIPLKL